MIRRLPHGISESLSWRRQYSGSTLCCVSYKAKVARPHDVNGPVKGNIPLVVYCPMKQQVIKTAFRLHPQIQGSVSLYLPDVHRFHLQSRSRQSKICHQSAARQRGPYPLTFFVCSKQISQDVYPSTS